MICPTCHGKGTYRNNIFGEDRPCPDCNGSGIVSCCEGSNTPEVTQESKVVESLVKVEYWDDPETPDNTGYYICYYGTAKDMEDKSPEDCVGPYDTRAQAMRILNETSDIKDKRQREHRERDEPTLPSPNNPPASSQASSGEGVQLELLETEKLRDVPTPVQSD